MEHPLEHSGSNTFMRLALFGSLATYGYYAFLGLKSPLPGQDQDVAQGLDVERHEFVTPDGVTLRLKRYANPAGEPVLMCHGFGSSGGALDLPREHRNMAVYLAREGFDVWVSSFRGCGREPYNSGCDEWTHTIDDLAVMDAPTLIDGVTEATGKRAFYIGHSMGGEVLYMYLQGVRFEDGHVVSDPVLVRQRHEKLAGGVTIGSPPAFWYPKGHPYHWVFESKAGKAAINAALQQMLVKEVTSPCLRMGWPRSLMDNHPRLVMAVKRTPAMMFTYCRRNADKDATTSLAKWGTGDVSAGMWVQLLQAMLEQDFLEHPGRAEPGEQYDYATHMGLVSLPIFFLTGDKDFTNAGGIKRFGYDGVSSHVKEYVSLPSYGHTDLIMGITAEQDVYPMISEWMKMLAGN